MFSLVCEPRLKMMMMMIIMGHELKGTIWGSQQEWEGERKGYWGEEDQNMLHVYVQRQYNETHQTLCEKGRKGGIGKEKREYNGRGKFSKVHCMHV
jgi:hypothetical protein